MNHRELSNIADIETIGNSRPPVGHRLFRVTEPASRAERKERTRQALLDGTLELLEDRSFASVSLREVTRAVGIVPTAFYRHFDSMEHLGVALVEDSTRVLRQMLRDARRDSNASDASTTLAVLARQVRSHEREFRFISRERYGGVNEVRRAISTELRMFATELAADLARTPAMRAWPYEDIEWAADLYVTAVFGIVENLLQADHRNPRAEREVVGRGENQLRLIAVGINNWKPRH